MLYVLVFSKVSLAEIEKHKLAGDKKTIKKIERLLNE